MARNHTSSGQLAAVHHGARRQRRLVAAGLALEQQPLALADPVVFGSAVPWATKSTRLADLSEFLNTLRFAAVASEKFRHWHPALELDLAGWHGMAPSVNRACTASI